MIAKGTFYGMKIVEYEHKPRVYPHREDTCCDGSRRLFFWYFSGGPILLGFHKAWGPNCHFSVNAHKQYFQNVKCALKLVQTSDLNQNSSGNNNFFTANCVLCRYTKKQSLVILIAKLTRTCGKKNDILNWAPSGPNDFGFLRGPN